MSASERVYDRIVRYCEACLERHGDTHRGVDWPKQEYATTSYDVMIGVIREFGERVSMLDVGCGLSHLYERILARGIDSIDYAGVDLSERFLAQCRAKFPAVPYFHVDLLETGESLPSFDYVIMNGVFTEKVDISFDAMWDYMTRLVEKAYSLARKGIAFNVMSKQVDWERDDLFHVPFDLLADFLGKKISRNFVFRHDYGMYQYTAYVYRESRYAGKNEPPAPRDSTSLP